MKKLNKISNILLTAIVAVSAMFAFSACNDDDDVNGVQLLSFGPCPVLRGDAITIIGTDLGKINKVVFPGEGTSKVEVTTFDSQTDNQIVVTVPQEAMPGKLKIVYGSDTITSKSLISYSEPISLESVTPTSNLLAGDVITLKGDYLNNVATITFAEDVVVDAEQFVAQSRKELRVAVPKAAVSGIISLSDGADTPTIVESEEALTIQTASYTGLSKTDVTEGETLTISGRNLQLVESVTYPGGVADESFVASADGSTLTSTVPAGVMGGTITLTLYSGASLVTDEITVPTISYTGINPSVDLAVGDNVTIGGANLNLVSSLELPGGITLTTGEFTVNANHTELTFTVPAGMVDGKITLVQNANVSVQTDAVTMKKEGNVIWTGNIELGAWSDYLQVTPDSEYWDAFQAIDGPGILTVNFTEDSASSYWQLRFQYSDWATFWDNAPQIYDMEAGATSYSVSVTANDVQHISTEGFVISGSFLTIQSIEFQKN